MLLLCSSKATLSRDSTLTKYHTQGFVDMPTIMSRGFLFLGRPPTYGKTTLSRPNLFREQDDIEGTRLRLRGVDGTIPRIPAVCADVFGSSVRHCIMELRISKDRCVGAGPTDRVTIAAEKQAELGFPTAAGDRRRLGVTAKA